MYNMHCIPAIVRVQCTRSAHARIDQAARARRATAAPLGKAGGRPAWSFGSSSLDISPCGAVLKTAAGASGEGGAGRSSSSSSSSNNSNNNDNNSGKCGRFILLTPLSAAAGAVELLAANLEELWGRHAGERPGRRPGRQAGKEPGRQARGQAGREPGKKPGRELGKKEGRREKTGREAGRIKGYSQIIHTETLHRRIHMLRIPEADCSGGNPLWT